MTERTCIECGGPIVGRSPKAITCGKDCARERLKTSDAYKRAKVKWRAKNPNRVRTWKPKPADCANCGATFTPTRWGQQYCTHDCYVESWRLTPDERKARTKAARRKRRALTRGAHAEDIHALDIYERDGWRCGICRRKVNPKLTYPHPMSATLDHVIPLSDGGAHTSRNTQCAHFRCNSAKGNRGTDQLRLIG